MGRMVAFSPAPAGKKSLPPLYAVISLIYVVAALSGAKNIVVVCSCPCGSLLLLHAEHKMCPRIKSTLPSLATPYIVLAITRQYRPNEVVEGGLRRVYRRFPFDVGKRSVPPAFR